MARALLLSATPAHDRTAHNLEPLIALQKSAAVDRFGVHAVTDDPEAADIIVFVEVHGAGFYFQRARCHAYTRKYREKCFIVSSIPFAIPFLPGIYTSVEKRWSSPRTRCGFYVGPPQNALIHFTPPRDDLPYLYSFMGSIATARVRRGVAALRQPRSFFQETSEEFQRILYGKMDEAAAQEYYWRYADLIKASKFVLLPQRGGRLEPAIIRNHADRPRASYFVGPMGGTDRTVVGQVCDTVA